MMFEHIQIKSFLGYVLRCQYWVVNQKTIQKPAHINIIFVIGSTYIFEWEKRYTIRAVINHQNSLHSKPTKFRLKN